MSQGPPLAGDDMESASTKPTPADSSATKIRISNVDFPEREQMAAWQDVFGRHIVQTEMTPLGDAPFRWEVVARSLPGLGTITAATKHGFLATRTPALISAGSDDLILTLMESGGLVFRQFGREIAAGVGDAVAVASVEVGKVNTIAESTLGFVALGIPRPALAPVVHDLESRCVKRLATEPLALLRHYLGVLQDEALAESQELQRVFATHVHDLVALALGASRDAEEIAKGRGVRAARLRALKDDIVANLHRTDLSLDAMAKRHRISPRYIRQLFADEATSFSDFVRAQRLVRAHRMLGSPRYEALTISAIAYDAGFNDLSNFNHAFRRAYGMTPSDVRAMSRTDTGTDE